MMGDNLQALGAKLGEVALIDTRRSGHIKQINSDRPGLPGGRPVWRG
ncbi:hypothetical protein [Maliponia aquimaris]|nr:hypothetical protein [Maliponia aquimaris]